MKRFTVAVVSLLVVGLAVVGSGCVSDRRQQPGGLVVAETVSKNVSEGIVTNSSVPRIRNEPLVLQALEAAATDSDGYGEVRVSETNRRQILDAFEHLPGVPGDTIGHYIRYNGTVYRVYVLNVQR